MGATLREVTDRAVRFTTHSYAAARVRIRGWLGQGPGRGIEPRLPARWLLVGLTLVLVFLAWILLGNLPQSPEKQPDLPLIGDSGEPKLKGDQQTTSPSPTLDKVEPAKFEVVESATPALPDTRPMLVQRHNTEQPPVDLPESEEPLVETIAVRPRETEAPMISTKSNVAVQMFLLGWFLSNSAVPALAGDGQEKKTEPTAGETADRLGKIERDLADLKKDMNFKELKEKVDGISKAIENLDKVPLQSQKNARDIAELAETVARLNQAVTKLQNDLASESRKAFSPAGSREGTAVPDGMSTIKLVNAWSTPMTVVIDKTSYRLEPGEVRPVTRKAGNFTYEVLGIQPAVPRTLVAGESMTIRIGAPQ